MAPPRSMPVAAPDAPPEELACLLLDGPVLFCTAGAELRLSWVNDAWERDLGWNAGELIGIPLPELVHPEDVRAVREILLPGRAADLRALPGRLRTRDGHHLPVVWHGRWDGLRLVAAAVPAAARAVTSSTASADRPLARAALRTREAQLAALMAATGEGVLFHDAAGQLVAANERAREWLEGGCADQLRPAEVLEAGLPQITALTSRGGRRYEATSRPVRAGREVLGIATTIVDASARWAESRAAEELLGELRDGYALVDVSGRVLDVNDRMAAITGYRREDLVGMRAPYPFWAAARRAEYTSLLAAWRTSGGGSGEVEIERPDGRTARAHAEARLLPVQEGPATMLLVVRDARAEDRVLRAAALHLRLLDAVDACVIATDLRGEVVFWNEGAEALFGFTASDALGRSVGELTMSGAASAAEAMVARVVRDGSWERTVELTRADGTAFPAYVRDSVFRDPHTGEPAGIIGVAVDDSARRASEAELRSAQRFLSAVTDSMAEGLFTLDEHGRLTMINEAGKQMLGWSEQDLLGRVMHDVVHDRHPDGSPFPASECPLVRVQQHGDAVRHEDVLWRRDGRPLPVSISARPFETPDGERGTVVVFSDISDRVERERAMRAELERVSWTGRIRKALAEDRFELHAQPIVDVATGRTVQHELLIRMRGEDGEMIPPGAFLPVAEQYEELIHEIDRWVVAQAAVLAGRGIPVQVNLSGRSLGHPDLLGHIATELRRHDADPRLVVCEITETAIVEDEEAARRFAQGLDRLGCGLALDDFGTGYGGFHYLKRLPLKFLKIDMEFVRDLPRDPSCLHVVQAVVNLARGFNQRTIAEGVEDLATMALLRDHGVDLAQGYALGRPTSVLERFPGTGRWEDENEEA